jgi:hypothetical protein
MEALFILCMAFLIFIVPSAQAKIILSIIVGFWLFVLTVGIVIKSVVKNIFKR